MDKATIELDAIDLAAVQAGLTLLSLQAQAALSNLQLQVQKQLEADSKARMTRTERSL